MKTFQTHNGKEIQLVRCNKTSHIKIQFNTGGELPQEFTGFFTSEREAEIAISIYLDRTKSRKKENKEE